MSDSETEKYKIVSDLEPLKVPIDSVQLDDKNANEHTERGIRELAKGLDDKAQRIPIVVQKKENIRRIEKGNGTVKAARRLGWTHIAAVFVEESDDRAREFAIEDNRLSQLSHWNEEILDDVIHEYDINPVGFDDDELDALDAVYEDAHLPGSDDENDEHDPTEGEREVSPTDVYGDLDEGDSIEAEITIVCPPEREDELRNELRGYLEGTEWQTIVEFD